MLSDVLHAGMKVHVASIAENRISSVITQIKHQRRILLFIFTSIFI